jgi:hypothetical protein
MQTSCHLDTENGRKWYLLLADCSALCSSRDGDSLAHLFLSRTLCQFKHDEELGRSMVSAGSVGLTEFGYETSSTETKRSLPQNGYSDFQTLYVLAFF